MVLPTHSAIAMAASFPDGTIRPLSASSRLKTSPVLSPALDSPTVAAFELTTISVSVEACSRAMMAVIIFVTDAICTGVSALRSKYTVPFSSTR